MPRHAVELLHPKRRNQVLKDLVLGTKSFLQVGKENGISDTSIARWFKTIPEEVKLKIIAEEAEKSKIAEAHRQADLVNELGADVEADLKWVLRELKTLLQEARDDDEKVLALGTLKEVRQSLMALADITGKLSRKVEVTFGLHESPAFLELRRVMLEVLEQHPEAKASFLERMGRLKVVGSS